MLGKLKQIGKFLKKKTIPQSKMRAEMERNEKILFHCDHNGNGLEIGAGYSPAAPKSQGYNIEVLDHASTQDLKNKYDHDPMVDIENIVDVDYVWNGEPYEELIGKSDHYDYVIASHVVEHTPDLIFFLQQIEAILKPGGVLSLAVPHKFRCFDYLRQISTTGQVLQAHLEGRKTHSPGILFDDVATSVSMNGATAWGDEKVENLKFFHKNNLQLAAARFQKGIDCETYIDAHSWYFTPSSFRLIVSDLFALNYIGLAECGSFDTAGCEFFVTLKKGGDPQPVDRLKLLMAAARGE